MNAGFYSSICYVDVDTRNTDTQTHTSLSIHEPQCQNTIWCTPEIKQSWIYPLAGTRESGFLENRLSDSREGSPFDLISAFGIVVGDLGETTRSRSLVSIRLSLENG